MWSQRASPSSKSCLTSRPSSRSVKPSPQRTILAAELVRGAKQGAYSTRTWFHCQHRPNGTSSAAISRSASSVASFESFTPKKSRARPAACSRSSHRARGIRSGARQLHQLLGVGGDPAPMLSHQPAGRLVEVHDPPVAFKVLPDPDGLGQRRFGERIHGWEALQKALVERNCSLHLDLLEHHLRNEDPPGVPRAAPRVIPRVLPNQ